MVRKFLYVVAVLIVLAVAGRVAYSFYPETFVRLAFEPGGKFEALPPLPADAYDRADMWSSRPDLAQDPVRWLPDGAVPGAAVPAAVFFVAPTTYLKRSLWNGPLDDAEASRMGAMMTRAVASAFNASPQLWAPRYRQATFGTFVSDKPEADRALDLAYGDVARAFRAFVSKVPKDSPIVLVGHSQGAFHLRRLVKEEVAGKPLARRVAAVYAIGWPISIEHDLPPMGLTACASPDQAGCLVSWLSFAEPADTAMMLHAAARHPGLDGQALAGSHFVCTNLLTGGGSDSGAASANIGTAVPDTQIEHATLKPALVAASCAADGTLRIGSPPDMGPFVLPGNNYHVYDVLLFWANLRADFARRVAAWKP